VVVSYLALTRRQFLIGLAGVVPAGMLLEPEFGWADESGTLFLRVSKTITGATGISSDVADRIESLLAGRDREFASHLQRLASALDDAPGTRAQKLSALSDDLVKVALEIAKPWYLGYVGTPSDFVMKDDAAFATFLEAQAYEKIIDMVPRPTYPGHGPQWWGGPPPGVDAPSMPAEIVGWQFYPEGPAEIKPPDPAWRIYAIAKYDNLDAARKAKPAATSSSEQE
jgi:hypothetical protein